MAKQLKIGIIGGGGWLAQTIVKALLAKGYIDEGELGVSYRSKAPADFSAALVTTDSQALTEACETIIVSVRPADFSALGINAEGKRLISVMAGVSLARLAEATKARRILRAMPNVAASIGYSYTPIVAAPDATPVDLAVAREIFAACGQCDVVGTEEHLDYLTGLTGSGPAYPALLAAALQSDAVGRGISEEIAARAVRQLLVGAGRLLEKDPRPMPEIVREFVDYKGVIAAAITTMQANGLDGAVAKGMDAALKKVKLLA